MNELDRKTRDSLAGLGMFVAGCVGILLGLAVALSDFGIVEKLILFATVVAAVGVSWGYLFAAVSKGGE